MKLKNRLPRIQCSFYYNIIILFLSIVINTTPIIAQTPCLSDKVLILQGAQISNKTEIQKQVENWHHKNGDSFLNETNERTTACLKNINKQLEIDIRKIENTINDFISQKNQLIKNKDITSIEKQLDEKTKSLEAIKQAFYKQLADISLQRVYIVLLNRGKNSGLSADVLLNEAKNFVVPKAIEDLNGVFINMIQTSATQNGLSSYSEIITQNIAGSLEIVPSFVQSEAVNGFNQKLFIITVKVSPLKREVFNPTTVQAPDGTKMLDINSVVSTLSFINEDQKQRIISKTQEFTAHCHEVNASSEKKKNTIITNYKNDIINIEDDIANLQRKLNRRKEELQGIIESVGAVYNATNIGASLSSAEQLINQKIEQQKQALIDKTKEIWDFPQVSKVQFDEDKPVEAIALQIQSAKERLDKAGLITLYSNTQQINQQGFKENTEQSVSVKRTVNEIWVVLVPKDLYWELVISAKYKLVKQADGSSIGNNNTTVNVNNNVGEEVEDLFEMIFVKGGSFTMGCTKEQGSDCDEDEKPAHQVRLSDYYISKFEVTQNLWNKVMGSNPSEFSNCGDNCPVESVSWDDCQEFIKKLNQMTGKRYRLPTEAEWEYAARGGNKATVQTKYAGSNDIAEVAWYEGNSGKYPHPVGTKKPNALGLYDMSGNVFEWCNDGWEHYSSESVTNPQGANSGHLQVYRGGSWFNSQLYTRVSNRRLNKSSIWSSNIGLRLAYSSN